MYEVGLSVSFHASHSLRGYFGPAQQVHEHDYRVDVVAIGPTLNDDGVLLDIVLIESAIRDITEQWNGRCLDDLPELMDVNTTVEALSAYLHKHLRTQFPEAGPTSLEVRVWESPTAWGAYRDI
ncbi:MAG: 6-pyruvoyl trahydropterin synthase family protein [Chloroflexota bacterium]